MVQLKPEEFRFLWGFALLVLFEGQNLVLHKPLVPLDSAKAKLGGDGQVEDTNPLTLKSYEIVLPVFQFLSTERFFSMGFLTMDICRELLLVGGLELFFRLLNVYELIFSVNFSCLSHLLTHLMSMFMFFSFNLFTVQDHQLVRMSLLFVCFLKFNIKCRGVIKYLVSKKFIERIFLCAR